MVNMRLLVTDLIAGSAFSWPAFGQETPRDSSNTSSIDINTKSIQLIDKDSVTVNFAPGSSDVTPQEKDKLRNLIESAKKEAPTDRFIVAAWSDKEFPAEGAELSKEDRDLAKRRGSAVKEALQDLRVGSIDTYSMATHPSWISRTFGRNDASIKTGGGRTTEKNEVATQIGQKLRSEGGPGTAVVVVRFENQGTSH